MVIKPLSGIVLGCALLMPFGSGSCAYHMGKEPYSSVTFDASQRALADQIISVFENNTPTLQYTYAHNLRDGRGITAGRAGFTSATGDMLDVLERYARRVPDNKLEAYIPRLQSLVKNWSGSTVGLAGLPEAWREAAADPVFREVQDEVVNQQYYQRAENYAQRIGAIEPLTLLLLYDAILQHGYGTDPDGLPELIRRTNRQLDGTPKDGVNEFLWAAQFLKQRRSSLLNAHNASTRSVWADSVGRVDTLAQLLDSGQTRLDQPVVVNPWGTEFILLPAGFH